MNKFKRRRKIGGKGVGEGTRKTACPKTNIFISASLYKQNYLTNRKAPAPSYQIAIEACH